MDDYRGVGVSHSNVPLLIGKSLGLLIYFPKTSRMNNILCDKTAKRRSVDTGEGGVLTL